MSQNLFDLFLVCTLGALGVKIRQMITNVFDIPERIAGISLATTLIEDIMILSNLKGRDWSPELLFPTSAALLFSVYFH